MGPRGCATWGAARKKMERACGGGVEERAPLPRVVLVAQLEIRQHDGHLGACDDEDEQHEREEAEDVVEALQPDGGHDEEELDEDGAEGEDAAHQHVERAAHVPRLLGDLPRDLVGAARVLVQLGLEAEEGAEEDEGDGDAEPHADERHDRAEGHGARRAAAPDEEVEEERADEDDARVEEGGE